MYDEYFIGDPASQMSNWIMQTEMDNCAVAAQVSIINQFLPEGLCLHEATYTSVAEGWHLPGHGTYPEQVGSLMDHYDIPNHTVYNATIEQLAMELQQGHGVIVGVRSSELWNQGVLDKIKRFFEKAFGLDTAEFNPADHAVVVTGIDVSDPANPQVIINDSGIPNGAAVRYPLDQFVDAWENSGFYYTSTSIPIPDSPHPAPSEVGFDIGRFLGIATTLVTGDPMMGHLVREGAMLLREVDWERIL